MSTENHVTPQGTYINGKGQVIDILRLLSPQEKARILNHINSKNPTMARELAERCVSFANVEALGDNELKIVFSQVDPKLMGVALKGTSVEFQRRCLSIVPRHLAEEAYRLLTTPLKNEREPVMKAQDKILNIAIQLNRLRRINLGN